ALADHSHFWYCFAIATSKRPLLVALRISLRAQSANASWSIYKDGFPTFFTLYGCNGESKDSALPSSTSLKFLLCPHFPMVSSSGGARLSGRQTALRRAQRPSFTIAKTFAEKSTAPINPDI